MDDGSGNVFTIIIGLVAVFVLLQLRRTLGKKTGYDGSDEKDDSKDRHPFDLNKKPQNEEDNIVPLYPDSEEEEAAPVHLGREKLGIEPKSPFYDKVVEMHNIDPTFNMREFIDGAEGAYAMILESFWRGDKEILKQMLNRKVCEQFSSVIDDFNLNGQSFGNEIKDIEKISLEDLSLAGSMAEVTLKFQTAILSFVKDSNGKVIDGNPDRHVVLNDIWTFVRDLKSSDPNWTLTKTKSI